MYVLSPGWHNKVRCKQFDMGKTVSVIYTAELEPNRMHVILTLSLQYGRTQGPTACYIYQRFMKTDHKIQQNVQRAKLWTFFPPLSAFVPDFSKPGAMDSFDVARLGLFEVNNIPDRSKILLKDYVSLHTSGTKTN